MASQIHQVCELLVSVITVFNYPREKRVTVTAACEIVSQTHFTMVGVKKILESQFTLTNEVVSIIYFRMRPHCAHFAALRLSLQNLMTQKVIV